MASHPYLRFLARVSARQPLLRAPPDATLTQVSPSDFLSFMPYTQPISGYRSRSFELRRMQLRFAELTAREHSPPPSPSARGSPPRHPNRNDGPSAGAATADAVTAAADAVIVEVNHAASASQLPPSPQSTGHDRAHTATTTTASIVPHGPTDRSAAAPGSAAGDDPAASLSPPLPHPLHPQGARYDTTAHVAPAAAGARPAAPAPCTLTHPPAAAAAARAVTPSIARSLSPPRAPPPPSPPPPHSYMEVHYPFKALPWLWRQYHRPGFPGLDPALVIEDFDTFAADVAARHVGHVPDSMLVTAFLERLTWHVHLRPGDGLAPAAGGGGRGGDERCLAPLALLAPCDMRMSGQVTWVGRSSMEVLLQLTTADAPLAAASTRAANGDSASSSPGSSWHTAPAANSAPAAEDTPSNPGQPRPSVVSEPLVVLPPGQLVATAEFVMALRDSSLRRAVDVPPLHPRDDLERELFQRGREHQRQRQARRDRDRDRDRDAASAAAAGKPASPPREPASLPAAGLTSAAPDGAADLARMLYDSVQQSELSRAVPTDAKALRLLQVDSEMHPGDTAQELEAEQPGTCQRRAKRARLDGNSSAGGAVTGGGSGRGCHNEHENDDHGRKLLTTVAVAAPVTPLDGGAATSTTLTPIRQTEVHRTAVAEFQDRNTSGTVFGGHLLRLAYEHAATAAAAFAGGPCELLWLEEGAISSPARVGDVLHAVARVVWSEPGGRALRVVVRVGKYNVSAPSQHVLALTLTSAFLADGGGDGGAEVDVWRGCDGGGGLRLRGVVPTSLTEAGEALAAQWRHDAAMAALARAEAADGIPARQDV